MQLIHRTMLDDPDFQRIAHVLQIAHVFGPGNVFADAVSRAFLPTLRDTGSRKADLLSHFDSQEKAGAPYQ